MSFPSRLLPIRDLDGHHQALERILLALDDGEGVIKIIALAAMVLVVAVIGWLRIADGPFGSAADTAVTGRLIAAASDRVQTDAVSA